MRDYLVAVLGTIFGVFLFIAWNGEDWWYGIVALLLIVAIPGLVMFVHPRKSEPTVTQIVIGAVLTLANTVLVYVLHGTGVLGTIASQDAEAFYNAYPFTLLVLFWVLFNSVGRG